jgi:hypothetical protein
LLCLVGALCPAFSATIIQYEIQDLPDLVVGQDLEAYRYFVSGFPFSANQGFTIYFDLNRYSGLTNPSAPNAQWNVLVLQPDNNLPADGAFDAVTTINGPSVASPFMVQFIRTAGIPASQPFDINEFDSQGNFVRVVESGFTVPRLAAVPEPDFCWVTGIATVFLLVRRRLFRERPAIRIR